MKQAGKGDIVLMGSDGLFDPAFSGLGSNVYNSFFPLNAGDPIRDRVQEDARRQR